MNPTIKKFGYPDTLLKEFSHWVILLRPAQVTLGSLVLAAKSEATAYGELSSEAFAEQRETVAVIERRLTAFVHFERINFLMLMMVDPNVHFHVIPRYSGRRLWDGTEFPDWGWPGPPRLDRTISLESERLARLASDVASNFD